MKQELVILVSRPDKTHDLFSVRVLKAQNADCDMEEKEHGDLSDVKVHVDGLLNSLSS